MKPSKITLLDLGGVVFQSTGISNEKIQWDIISSLNHKYGHELNIGENRFPEFLAEYNHLSQQNLAGEEFLQEVFNTLEINQELIDLVRKESEIIIVSDNYRENIHYISRRYNFDSWAIKQIYSFDYKMVKANPAFFPKLLKDLQDYSVEDLLFIDDSPEKIASAEKSGIRGIQYQNNEQVKEELEKLWRYI